mgnify:FL=1
MNDVITPNANAIADAMLKRSTEILRQQAATVPARETLADLVISTLKTIGAPSMMISGQKSLDAINVLLKATEAEKAKISAPLRIASYFVNDAPSSAKPHYAQVGNAFSDDAGVFPLYFDPVDLLEVKPVERITTERISALWDGMPGGCAGFMRQWGYTQFARAVENEVRATLLAALGPRESETRPVRGASDGASPDTHGRGEA